MATFPSMAKAEIDGGVPPFLNAQMSRGATLKKDKNSVLKERYHFCIVVQNSAAVAANKTFTIVMDCIIP